MQTIVITSGGFDPIHQGHIEYLKKAKAICSDAHHICIVNGNDFLLNKKGYFLLDAADRLSILGELGCVDSAVPSIDKDMTVCATIEAIHSSYCKLDVLPEFVFAKGGDRSANEIPEAKLCRSLGIKIIDGLGDKINSSSELVNKIQCS